MRNEAFREFRPLSAEPLVVGQPVEIRRGLLKKLSGVLVGFGGRDKCLVELDGLQRGILLSIGSTSVRQRGGDLAASVPTAGEEQAEWPRP